LYNKNLERMTIEFLSKISVLKCEEIFNKKEKILLYSIIGLLPYLCLHIKDIKEENVSLNLSKSCDNNNLIKISKVFLRYSKGHYTTYK
jgi:hypothetical protein